MGVLHGKSNYIVTLAFLHVVEYVLFQQFLEGIDLQTVFRCVRQITGQKTNSLINPILVLVHAPHFLSLVEHII